jgi:hypothetical protein
MTDDAPPAKAPSGEPGVRPQSSRNQSRGRRYRRPPRRPRGPQRGFGRSSDSNPDERPVTVEPRERIEAGDTSPAEEFADRDLTEEGISDREPERVDQTDEFRETDPGPADAEGDPEGATPAGSAVSEPRRDPLPPPRQQPQRRLDPPRDRQSHSHQHQQRQPAPQRPPPPSVAKAIDETKGIIEELTEALDDMEHVLRTLEDAEVQKNADEREIETLRRQLKLLSRRGEAPRHQPQQQHGHSQPPRQPESGDDS